MFVCRGCLRSLTGAATSTIRPRVLGPLQGKAGSIPGLRTYWGKGIQVDVKSALADTAEPTKPPSKKKKAADDEEPLAYENLNPESGEVGRQRYEKKLELGVKKHLSLMPDPYHIAQYISKALEKGSFDEALLMTRMASRNKKVEVSWNHLIDYQMKNRRLHAAVKLYNEMKKRAQVPNAKTYTIIFRGCAMSLHPKLAVSEATRIYNFMIKQGALKPNTIHMNAVLEVCARAGDMESLFTVLATANESVRSPDAHTFTIVLNALRHEALGVSKKNMNLIDEEVKREVQNNIQKARALWADVIASWRNAKLIIDEHLVSAMGRVLTAGQYHDNISALELLEQTMRIPRFDKPDVALPRMPGVLSDTGDATPDKADSVDNPPAPDTSNLSPKARKALASSSANSAPIYAKPGNKSLSLALTALTNTRKTSSAPKYWEYFTRILGVAPDPENYYCYLRALAVGHASGQVASLIEAMPRELVSALTFRRGFATCVHDNLNKNAFGNACRIFDVMTATQRYADPASMRLFLQVARGSTRHFHEQPDGKGGGTEAHGRQIAAALDRLWEPFRILSGSLSYPETAARSPQEELDRKRGDMQEIMATARRMMAAIDRIVTGDMVDHKLLKLWRTRRIILQKAFERWASKLYPDRSPIEAQRKATASVLEEEDLKRESSRQAARQAF